MFNFVSEFRRFNIVMNDCSDIDIYCHDWSLLGYDEESYDDLISFELHNEEFDEFLIIAMFEARDVRYVREYCHTDDGKYKYLKTLYPLK